jgi:hypothetical protein
MGQQIVGCSPRANRIDFWGGRSDRIRIVRATPNMKGLWDGFTENILPRTVTSRVNVIRPSTLKAFVMGGTLDGPSE